MTFIDAADVYGRHFDEEPIRKPLDPVDAITALAPE